MTPTQIRVNLYSNKLEHNTKPTQVILLVLQISKPIEIIYW